MLADPRIPLESVLVTEELSRRASRPPDYELQCSALEELAGELATSPSTVLRRLTEIALNTCRAGSAGLSLLSSELGREAFHWPAIAGAWASNTGGSLPFDASPCGVVVTRGSTQLFQYPERHYLYSVKVDPPICEALLEPFFVDGKAVGTIWLISHDEERRFDREDARLLACLGRFAAQAFQVLRAIDALEPSNQRLAAIVEGSDDAIISKDLSGVITSWNAGAERLFGYPAFEAIGQLITLVIPEDRSPEEADILRRIRQGERIQHFETIRRRKDGSLVEISLSISHIRNSKGEIVGASKIARDISERKRIENALLAADRQKNEFLATLAHELRNPLAPIRTSLHVLRLRDDVDQSSRELQEVMERQLNHLVRLVDDLLEVARISTGKIDLKLQPLEIASLIRTAVETSRPLIDAARHQLSVSVPPHAMTVTGDAVRLSQVVANLLNNSAKFTDPGGKIWLTVTSNASTVSISVRDNGIGIPAAALPDVLKMFTQVRRNQREAKGGLGIGLALVQRLVELHNGSVEAYSDGDGQGSEFVVRLPLATQPSRSPSPAFSNANRTNPASESIPQKVLIVDDNRDAASSLGTLLQMLGSDIRTANCGEEALRVIEGFHPEVILLDLGMPGMDGFEVAERLQRLPRMADVLLIALTGWGQAEDRRRTTEAGFDYHFVKPLEPALLLQLLRGTSA